MNSKNLRSSRSLLPQAAFAAALLVLPVGRVAAATYTNVNVTTASLYEESATNILDGSSATVTAYGSATYAYGGPSTDVYVGNALNTTTLGNVSLIIENGGSLTSATFYIGRGYNGSTTAGCNNSVTVGGTTSGDTSTLAVNGYTRVGNLGSGNSLLIQSGAKVTGTSSAHIGSGSTSSTNTVNGIGYNNSVTVTGSDSSWTLVNSGTYQSLYVGRYGCSNNLSISSGGAVSCGALLIGNGDTGYTATGCNNSVKVGADSTTGDASTLAVNSVTYVGFSGSSNTLTIQSGADVTGTAAAYIGFGDSTSSTTSSGGYNNSVKVTGTGSTWTLKNSSASYESLYVGYYGCSNRLLICAGGSVANSAAYIGYQSTSTSNIVAVSGSGSEWYCSGALAVGSTSTSGQGSLIIDDGALVKASSITFGTTTATAITLTSDVTALLTTDATLASVTANKIYLGSGSFLAISTDVRSSIDSYLSGIMVYDSATKTWVLASSADGASIIKYYYVDGTSVTSSSLTGGVYTDLTDYTVIYYTSVPEPATCALLGGLGALGLALYRRRVQQA